MVDIKLTLVDLSISSIVPNEYNPNILPDGEFAALKRTIERDGFHQHIRVRPHETEPNKYIIIDGEHRWKALKELGFSTIPAEIENKTLHEAQLETITMNKLRGNIDSIKMGELLTELRTVYSVEDLENYLGYSPSEIESYISLVSFDPESMMPDNTEIPPDMGIQDGGMKLENEFSVLLSLYQLDLVESALKTFGDDKAKALEQLCSDYLLKEHPEVLGEVDGRQAQYDQADKDASAGNT